MRKRTAGTFLLAVCVTFGSPSPVSSQFSLGANASFVPGINTGASEAGLDATMGMGGRVEIGVPRLGIRLQGSLEMFFPDCGAQDCEFEIGTAAVVYDIVTGTRVTPFLGGGVSVQNSDGGDSTPIGNKSDWGGHLVAGARMGSARLRPFVDVRYHIMPDFENQIALSAGLTLTLWNQGGP